MEMIVDPETLPPAERARLLHAAGDAPKLVRCFMCARAAEISGGRRRCMRLNMQVKPNDYCSSGIRRRK